MAVALLDLDSECAVANQSATCRVELALQRGRLQRFSTMPSNPYAYRPAGLRADLEDDMTFMNRSRAKRLSRDDLKRFGRFSPHQS